MGAPKAEFPPLLPFGFHQMTADELKKLLVDEFPKSTRRAKLWENLSTLVADLKSKKIKCKLWLDGSYLTQKIDPDDIDIVVEVNISVIERANPEQREALEDLKNMKYMNEPIKLHTFVIFSAPMGHVLGPAASVLQKQWIDDWGYSLIKREPKGIALMEVLP